MAAEFHCDWFLFLASSPARERLASQPEPEECPDALYEDVETSKQLAAAKPSNKVPVLPVPNAPRPEPEAEPEAEPDDLYDVSACCNVDPVYLALRNVQNVCYVQKFTLNLRTAKPSIHRGQPPTSR